MSQRTGRRQTLDYNETRLSARPRIYFVICRNAVLRRIALPPSTDYPCKCNLPQLQLLKFDGNCRSCQPFWTHFSAAIHKSDKLSTTDKLNYFSNPATATAASAVSGLQATDHSYKDAIEILKEHCGDNRIIVRDHRRGFLDLKPVTSSSDIRQLKQHMIGSRSTSEA